MKPIPLFLVGACCLIAISAFGGFEKPKPIPPGGLEGLPVHPVLDGELKGLQGSFTILPGEYLYWNYNFNWAAYEQDSHEKVDLTYGMQFRFVRDLSSSAWVVYMKGKSYGITCPPNTYKTSVLRFCTMQPTGIPESILLNRIGKPTNVNKAADGGKVLVYTKEVVYDRQTFQTITSTTSGMIGTDFFNASTTTYVPKVEEIRYNPYSFAVYIDAKGNVDHIDDLCTKAASWTPK